MKRRDFISKTCGACLGATTFAAIFSACKISKYVPGKLGSNGLTIATDDFKIQQGGKTSYRSYIVVKNDELLFPICVYRFGDKEYSALWLQCAHQGAEVQVAGTHLQCSAHGSEYDNRGRVTKGPAETGLRTFPVTVSNSAIFIDLRKQS